MQTFAQVLLAALAVSAAQAAPQVRAPSNSSLESFGMPRSKPAPVNAEANAALLKELSTTSTANERFQKLLVGGNGELLQGQELVDRTVFDFEAAKKASPGAKGGETAGADVSSFPILKDLGLATTVGFVEPCGMNTAHVHPRASEFLTVVKGELQSGMILQNGLLQAGKGTGEIRTHLSQFQGTVFPQGSIHYQFNPSCAETIFVAHLNAEDPGTNQIAQGFFNLDGDVVAATLGFSKEFQSGKDIERFRSQIPANLALGVEQCLKKCNIPKNEY